MRVVGLFAGIGGIELGLRAAGHDSALLCEINPLAQAVLAARFPAAALVDDITRLPALPGETDIVTAGFPCQDLSQAGRTQGIDGARSGLVAHVFRLLDGSTAPLVVLENVSFMLQLDGGRAMATLVTQLEQRGFRWAYRVVNSMSFVPQRRERVFLVASRCDIDPWDVLLTDDVIPVHTPTSLETHAHGFYWTEGIRGLGWAPDAVPTLKNGSTVGIPSPPAILMPGGGPVIKPDIRDAERLQGFPADWTLPASAVGRPSLRWSLVGNAVTAPMAAWLGERLAQPGCYDCARDGRLTEGGRWPKAARGGAGMAFAVDIGAYPRYATRPSLASFLRHPGEPLSERATKGFLGRTETSSLRFVPGFIDRVREHLSMMQGLAMAAE